MSTISSLVPTPQRIKPALPSEPVWRLTVEQYHEMVRTGILTEDDPVELLEGWLVPKIPKNRLHRLSTRLIRLALESLVPAGWYVDSQEPVTLADGEPEPDVMIVRGNSRDYRDRHPGLGEVALVVEVADTSLSRDKGLKKRSYARAGIPVYWIMDLNERRLDIYTEPSGPGEQPDFLRRQECLGDEEVTLVIEGEVIGRLALGEMLP